jgi:hypothetical protein
MLQPVRRATNLANSLLALEDVMRRRNCELREHLLKVKSAALGFEASWNTPWPRTTSMSSSFIPAVKVEAALHSFDAASLLKVEEVHSSATVATGECYNVTEKAKPVNGRGMPPIVWKVQPRLASVGPFEDACACGRYATEFLSCQHMQAVLERAGRGDHNPEEFRKLWLTVDAWQKQVGRPWEALKAHEIIANVARVQAAEGPAAHMVEPVMAIQGCGRPSGKLNAETSARLKAFWEVLKEAELMSEVVVQEVC